MPQIKHQRISPNHRVSISHSELIRPTPGRPIRVVIHTAAQSGTFGVYAARSINEASSANALYEKTSEYPAIGDLLEFEWSGTGALVIKPGNCGAVSVSQL